MYHNVLLTHANVNFIEKYVNEEKWMALKMFKQVTELIDCEKVKKFNCG